jgi:hypothetical protein
MDRPQIDLFGAKLTASRQTAAGAHSGGSRARTSDRDRLRSVTNPACAVVRDRRILVEQFMPAFVAHGSQISPILAGGGEHTAT